MVTSMLEKAIEIEGLLRIIKDGNPLPETYTLLNKKVAELAEQAACLDEQPANADTHSLKTSEDYSNADFVMSVPAPTAPAASEVVFSVKEPTPADDSLARTIEILSDLGEEDPDQEDLSLIEEDDILLTFEDANEEILPAVNPTEKSLTNQVDTKTDAKVDAKDKEEAKPTPPKRRPKLKSVFSLNDRFLYARELFNGNMKMFDSTLDFIEGIEDYSIIEDYFYSEMEWDPENGHVASFMEILRPHFRE